MVEPVIVPDVYKIGCLSINGTAINKFLDLPLAQTEVTAKSPVVDSTAQEWIVTLGPDVAHPTYAIQNVQTCLYLGYDDANVLTCGISKPCYWTLIRENTKYMIIQVSSSGSGSGGVICDGSYLEMQSHDEGAKVHQVPKSTGLSWTFIPTAYAKWQIR